MPPAKASVGLALGVQLEAKPGKEEALAEFLRGALSVVEEEPGTVTWYAIRMGPSTFGIFDTFADESGRQAHLSGRVAAALGEHAPDLLQKAPAIERFEVLASKIPG